MLHGRYAPSGRYMSEPEMNAGATTFFHSRPRPVDNADGRFSIFKQDLPPLANNTCSRVNGGVAMCDVSVDVDATTSNIDDAMCGCDIAYAMTQTDGA